MGQPESLADAITKLNHRLKVARLGLRVEQRGERLTLRGTLPPKPDSDRAKPHQQRIPLGLPATKAGLKQAEQEAKVIAARLIERTFDWATYLPSDTPTDPDRLPLDQLIDQFQQHLLSRSGPDIAAQAALKSTWKKPMPPTSTSCWPRSRVVRASRWGRPLSPP